MSKTIFFLEHQMARNNAIECIKQAPEGYCVEVKPKTRTLEQNRRMWAMLTDIANQVVWYGKVLTPENWKDIFSACLKKQEAVPGIDGGFVILGQSTSKMSIKEMLDLQELMAAFGQEKNIKWTEAYA
jgi:NinB protein